ncbi:unnamed protein product [Cladocopium goreaui]|uniref:Ankyrin repeat domain-containing protein 50 n=1 Tax=Cladocopium goreaui TaxID=2562237 RepID=A0A9P1G5G3_9DINO|nr:unnamed protein product [Cladocopium goreaui]
MPNRLSMSQSAVQLRSLPRLHSCEQQGSERVGKAEEYMYLQVKRSHWPTLSPDCRLWTLRDFALQHSNWDSFTDKGKLRVIYELGALLCESGDKLKEDAMLKARNDLQLAVTEARQLPRVVRSDKLRATAVAGLCEGLNLPSAARRLKEALGAAKREEYDTANLFNLAKKFHFKGYIRKIEDRSITVTQLRRVLKYCSEVCHHWYELPKDEVANPSAGGPPLSMEVLNLYHIDSWLIWPATEAYRSSFIELIAEQAQPANWCVSHCWSQPHTSLVECISQHVQTRSLHRSSNFWIWAYAHRSGFCDALSLAEGRLLLVLQDVQDGAAVQSTPFDRLWCMFEVWQCLAMGRDRAMTRTPLDLAVGAPCDGGGCELMRSFLATRHALLEMQSKLAANVMTYNLTETEEVFKSRLSDLRFSSLVLVSLVLAYLEFYVELTWRSWHSDPICCSGTVFVVASFVTQSCFPSCVTSTSMAILAAGSATLQDNQAVVSHAGPAATAYTRPEDRVITGQVPVHESRQPATTQPVGSCRLWRIERRLPLQVPRTLRAPLRHPPLNSNAGKGKGRGFEIQTWGSSQITADDELRQAMDCRSPGSGSAEKALREKDFPVSVIAASLQQRLEVAEMSWDEDCGDGYGLQH